MSTPAFASAPLLILLATSPLVPATSRVTVFGIR